MQKYKYIYKILIKIPQVKLTVQRAAPLSQLVEADDQLVTPPSVIKIVTGYCLDHDHDDDDDDDDDGDCDDDVDDDDNDNDVEADDQLVTPPSVIKIVTGYCYDLDDDG